MWQKPADLLFLTRPILLVPVWAYFILGYVEAIGHARPAVAGILPLPLGLSLVLHPPGSTWLVLLVFSVLMAGVHVLNQIADMDTDKKNPGFPLLARGVVPLRFAIGETLVLLVIAVACSWALGPVNGMLFSGAIVLGFLYCMRPFRWSGRPILDFLSNAAGYGLITFCLGWHTATGELSIDALLRAVPYCSLMIAGSIASTVPDLPGDIAEGKKTTVVRFGIRNAAIIGACGLVIAIILSIAFRLVIPLFVGVLSMPFFAKLILKPTRGNGYPAYQIGGGALVLIALLLCPPALVLSLVVLFSTKVYFWTAHRVRYPKMGH